MSWLLCCWGAAPVSGGIPWGCYIICELRAVAHSTKLLALTEIHEWRSCRNTTKRWMWVQKEPKIYGLFILLHSVDTVDPAWRNQRSHSGKACQVARTSWQPWSSSALILVGYHAISDTLPLIVAIRQIKPTSLPPRTGLNAFWTAHEASRSNSKWRAFISVHSNVCQ